jgi:hypothetical protein
LSPLSDVIDDGSSPGKMKWKPMAIVEARQPHKALFRNRDLRFIFAYFGLAICMLGTIYVAALSPGNTPGDLALMSVFP